MSADGDADLLNPTEVLLAGFAACMLKNVKRFAEILRFAYEQAAVRVHAVRQESPPRITEITYTLHLWTAEPPHRVELLHRNLRKFGTVYNTLAACANVSGQVEPHSASGTAAGPTALDG